MSRRSVAAIVIVVVGLFAAVTLAQVPNENYCGVPPGMWREPTWSPAPAGAVIAHAQTMFRHGDRVPCNALPCWPDDTTVWNCSLTVAETASTSKAASSLDVGTLFRFMPVPNEEYFLGDCTVGQLTDDGFAQQVANGKTFRAAYVGKGKLLPETYDPDRIYFQTDTSPRVQQSTQGVFEGMYPPSSFPGDVPLVNIMFQDDVTNPLLPNAALCPQLANITIAYAKSAAGAAITKRFAAAMASVGNALGIPPSSFVPLLIGDCYWTRKCHGLALPPAVTQAQWDEVFEEMIANINATYHFPTRQIYARYSMGYFVGMMVDNAKAAMQAVAAGSDDYIHMHLYGSHDSGVMPLLNVFDLLDYEWTPYAGYALFELWDTRQAPSVDDDFAVRLIRYGEETVIPGCSDLFCPWSEFMAIVEPMIPTADECSVPHG